ncbi:MAG: hypothetical protein AAB413_02545 [Patescibacteria group bacterium]
MVSGAWPAELAEVGLADHRQDRGPVVGLIAVASGDPLRHDTAVADEDEGVAGAGSALDLEDPHERGAGDEDRGASGLLGEAMIPREGVRAPQTAGDVGTVDRTDYDRVDPQILADPQVLPHEPPVVGRHRGEADQDVIPVAVDELGHVEGATVDRLDRILPVGLAVDLEGRVRREVEQAGARGGRGRVWVSTRVGGEGSGRFGHEEGLSGSGLGQRASTSAGAGAKTRARVYLGGRIPSTAHRCTVWTAEFPHMIK